MKKLIFFILLASGCMWGQSFYQFPQPLPNARFYVCSVPPVGNPCTNTASIFQDQAQTIPILQPAQIGPTGNFSFWVAGGQYQIEVQAPYNLTYIVSLGGGGGGGGVTTFNGRSGAVVPATNDYNFNQLAGSLALSQFPNGVVTNGATTVGTLPVFVTNAQTLGNSLWTDNGTSSLYSGSTVGVGTGDPSCGSAIGAVCMTEGSTEGTPTPGHDYIRPDAASVYSAHALVASVNGDGPFLMVRSKNTGSIGQVEISNGDGTFTAGDPNISVNTVSLFSGQSATATATSPATTDPLRSGYGTLSISGTGITGSPAGCSIALFYNMASGGAQDATPFATVFFVPGNPKQNFTVAPLATVGSQGDNIVAVYACGTYPSAGSFTASFNPAMPVAPSGSSLPMNIQAVGGQSLSQNLAISHDPSQASTCVAQSNAATNTITLTGLVINSGDTVMVGVGGSSGTGTVTVTDNGSNTYTLIRAVANGSARANILSTTASGAAAATSVTVTESTNQKFVACVSTYVGVQSFGSTGANSGTSNAPAVGVTTQDPGNFEFAVIDQATTNVMTANQGTLLATAQTTATTPASAAICDITAGQPSSLTCSVSVTSAAFAAAGVELRSSASTGASLPVQLVVSQPQLTTPLNVATQLVGSSGNISPIACDKTAISQALATSGSTQIIAASGTKNIYVCGWTVNSASTVAVTAKLVVGTGSNCATGPQDLSGQVTLQALSANSPVGQSITPPSDTVWNNNSIATPVANPALCVNLSSANSINVQVWYAQF